MSKIKVTVTWGKEQIVHPSYQTYGICWLREISLRQLLAHIVNKVNARIYSLDNARTRSSALLGLSKATMHLLDASYCKNEAAW